MQAASAASLQLDSRYCFRISFKKDTGCRTVPVAHKLSAVTNFMLKKQFFASKMEELQKQRAVLTEQLSQLITQKSLETRVEEESRLEYLIKQVKDKREQIEQEMLQLEAKSIADGKDVVDCGQRIQQALMQLIAYLTIDPAVGEVFPMLNKELNRMKGEGIASDDEIILEKIRELSEQGISSTDFVIFFKELNSAEKKSGNQPDYKKLAEQLKNGQVILCVGQELPHLFDSQLPSTEEIKRHLSQKDFHGPLSELCEQKEIALNSSRADLINDIRALFTIARKKSNIALYELLADLDSPFLVISTCYDDLLEKSLQGRRKSAVIHPNMEEGKCLLRFSDQKEVSCTPEEISGLQLLENGWAVIYRLRGGIFNDNGHLLLSERDYFTFTRFMQQQFPDYIGSRLKSSLQSLWFLGHHPESWEERLIVKSLQELRHDRAPSLTVQEGITSFARSFWQDRKVKVHDLSLAEFIQKLEAAL